MKKEYKYVIALVVFVLAVEISKFTINKFGLFDDFLLENEINDTIESTSKEPQYTIENHDIEVVINESGDLVITEILEYDIKEATDKVYRYYSIKENEEEGKYLHQPQILGITKIKCNGKEVKDNISIGNALLLNKDKTVGKKVYEIEYILEDAVEKYNNVSEFFCNLNLGSFSKYINDLDIVVRAENLNKILDARLIVGSGNNDFSVSVEGGIVKAHTDKLLPDVDIWLNAKLENECVPNTERIMLEERELKF